MYKRFVKFLQSIVSSYRQSLKFLLNCVCDDVRSLTGANLRKIKNVTGINVTPGITSQVQFNNCWVYEVPEGDEWKLPLLHSLLEIRSENWEILFNEEEEGSGDFDGDDLSTMIEEVCTT